MFGAGTVSSVYCSKGTTVRMRTNGGICPKMHRNILKRTHTDPESSPKGRKSGKFTNPT